MNEIQRVAFQRELEVLSKTIYDNATEKYATHGQANAVDTPTPI
ncbi:MAG: hypothetical protein ACSLEL_01050 [Candidatus Malihini olakiniferum]